MVHFVGPAFAGGVCSEVFERAIGDCLCLGVGCWFLFSKEEGRFALVPSSSGF